MIVSTGIDIVEVYRIRETLERTPRFRERVFTEAERTYCDAKGAAAGESYAARFAAKEAVAKALGTGIGDVSWLDIEIRGDENNAPRLYLSGMAEAKAKEKGASAAATRRPCIR